MPLRPALQDLFQPPANRPRARDRAGRGHPQGVAPRVLGPAPRLDRVVQLARLELALLDPAAADCVRTLSAARIAAASRSCSLAGNGPERCQAWSWKSFLPRGRRSGRTCSRSGAELAAAPSVAGSSAPRRVARRRMPARPLPISNRRERKSRCGMRSPAKWRTGPRRSAASREPLAAPTAAPVATWRATITAPYLAECPQPSRRPSNQRLGQLETKCGAVHGTSPRDGVGCDPSDLLLTATQRAYVLQNSLLRGTRLLERDQAAARSDFVTRGPPACRRRGGTVRASLGDAALRRGQSVPSHVPPCAVPVPLFLTVVVAPDSASPPNG